MFHNELELFELMKDVKPWEPSPLNMEDEELIKLAKRPYHELKHMRYDKAAREQAKFIDAKN